jgi:hypothetical protein
MSRGWSRHPRQSRYDVQGARTRRYGGCPGLVTYSVSDRKRTKTAERPNWAMGQRGRGAFGRSFTEAPPRP